MTKFARIPLLNFLSDLYDLSLIFPLPISSQIHGSCIQLKNLIARLKEAEFKTYSMEELDRKLLLNLRLMLIKALNEYILLDLCIDYHTPRLMPRHISALVECCESYKDRILKNSELESRLGFLMLKIQQNIEPLDPFYKRIAALSFLTSTGVKSTADEDESQSEGSADTVPYDVDEVVPDAAHSREGLASWTDRELLRETFHSWADRIKAEKRGLTVLSASV